MIYSHEEIFDRHASGQEPFDGAAAIRNELSEFCNQHWYELPGLVRSQYKYMWEYIYSYFDGADYGDHYNWYEVYCVIRSDLISLKEYHGMNMFEIAQDVADSYLSESAPVWVQAILDGEVSGKECYQTHEHARISPKQLAEIKKRINEHEKIRIKL